MTGETDLPTLLAQMEPAVAHDDVVVVSTPTPIEAPALATVTEDEGITMVVRRDDADRLGLEYDFVATWITLRVHSSLEAVGLIAAISAALTAEGISCNVLAGAFHDHLLVPVDRAADAMATLRALAG